MTIGEKLKRARKKLNLELDDVARDTKIAKMFLIAMENDDVTALPGGVYTRNFLRTYAQFLRLDEDIITAEYHEQYEIKPHFVLQQEQTKMDDGDYKRQRRRHLLIMLIVLLVAALIGAFVFEPWGLIPSDSGESHPQLGSDVRSLPLPTDRIDSSPGDAGTNPIGAGTVTTTAGSATTAPSQAGTSPPPSDVQTRDVSASSAADRPLRPPDSIEDRNSLDESASSPAAREDDPAPGSGDPSQPTPPMRDDLLPVHELDGLTIVNGEAERLEDLFIIYAMAPVRIEVYIDGASQTNRQIEAGDYRAYRTGYLHTIKIWDLERVVIQEGSNVFRPGSDRSGSVLVTDFKSGRFIESLQRVLEESTEN
ncbi:Helix-turn-helix domain-containing protein [Sulfidibacter corallicola]|uniref:Helix-turn-helix domain-containing protein n=1 Tax=Sulfidibacter corallicola TaxID=2818388 RepID=A0A8A4TV74_SULCO|nr:helix-turn-helix domain-containing protein [Sulfidibacter corallicola]QTD53024.1 helix-turn-helix domain-containing protein [Sulfidibacter corallicola]